MTAPVVIQTTHEEGPARRSRRNRRRIRSAFSHYLSPTLVEQLANQPNRLVLGGETRNMTIMFSDVRGFTTISETFKDDPQGLTSLMNRLLTPLTNSIIDRNYVVEGQLRRKIQQDIARLR